MSDLMAFFDALLQYEIELWNVLDDAVQQEHGVTYGRLHALRMVSTRGGTARVQDIANDLQITVGATSKLVDRLEADGTARRVPNPSDRRSSLISLTDAGASLLAAGMATVAEVLSGTLLAGSLAEGELDRLTDALQRLHEHLLAPGVAVVGV